MCIDIDLEKNVKHAQWHKYTKKRGHQVIRSSGPLCIAPCIVRFPAVCSKIWSSAPRTPYICETAFSHRFQKVYTTPPPPREQYFGASEKNFKNSRKNAKTHRVSAQCISPRDMQWEQVHRLNSLSLA